MHWPTKLPSLRNATFSHAGALIALACERPTGAGGREIYRHHYLYQRL